MMLGIVASTREKMCPI
uniref:Uncharacterized protein n=1 Tax=Lepeophtheirus salmonis TaxID=72036 RepID=A0A0K2TTT2_LEPSM